MKPFRASYSLCTYCGVLQLSDEQPIQHAHPCPQDHEYVESGSGWFLTVPNAPSDAHGPYRTKQEALSWMRLFSFRKRRKSRR